MKNLLIEVWKNNSDSVACKKLFHLRVSDNHRVVKLLQRSRDLEYIKDYTLEELEDETPFEEFMEFVGW